MLKKITKITVVGLISLSFMACSSSKPATEPDAEATGKKEDIAETEPVAEQENEVSEVITEAKGLSSGPLTLVANDGEEWAGSAEQDIAYKFERKDGDSEYTIYVTDNGELDLDYKDLQEIAETSLSFNAKDIYLSNGWAEEGIQVEAQTVEVDGKTFPAIVQHAESGGIIQDETDILILDNGKMYVVAVICSSQDGSHKKPADLFPQFQLKANGIE